jgi:hypothetical protein
MPVMVFGFAHMKRAAPPQPAGGAVGYALFATALVLLAQRHRAHPHRWRAGRVKDPTVRSVAYWLHVITPLVAAWLFVLHRLAGKRIRWKVGLRWAAVAGGLRRR